jgi:hypothetical protein
MDVLIGLAVFFVIWGIIIWRLKVMQLRTEHYIDAAYTKPNSTKFSGYWHWPKSPDI